MNIFLKNIAGKSPRKGYPRYSFWELGFDELKNWIQRDKNNVSFFISLHSNLNSGGSYYISLVLHKVLSVWKKQVLHLELGC